MLSAIAAGFAVCNVFLQRRAFASLLERCMPFVLCFFFTTTGMHMDLPALRRTWPVALALFGARLLSLYLGCAAGARWAGASVEVRDYSWLAFITQAGVSLGLIEQVAEKFPTWGAQLEGSLVAVIVLNQLVGPPLLKHALRATRESGQVAYYNDLH